MDGQINNVDAVVLFNWLLGATPLIPDAVRRAGRRWVLGGVGMEAFGLGAMSNGGDGDRVVGLSATGHFA